MSAPTLPGQAQSVQAAGRPSRRGGVPSQPSRLIAPPSRRRPSRVVAGAAFLVVAVAAGFVLFQRDGGTSSVLVIARPVAVGSAVTADDLAVAQAKPDAALSLVSAADERRVIGQIAAVTLRPGTTLALSQLGGPTTPSQGEQVVGIALRPGLLPARPLVAGDRVSLDEAPDATGASATAGAGSAPGLPGPTPAVVTEVGKPDSTGVVVVDVEVATAIAPTVAAESAAGRVVLTLLPASP